MATLKDMDICLPELKKMLKVERNPNMRVAIQFAMDIIQQLPVVKTEDCVPCKACAFYSADRKRCTHDRGLLGRVLPEMYCSYGSFSGENSDEEFPDDDFSEFEEDDNGSK